MPITILISNKLNFQLLYSAEKFIVGITVTGYFIYPDLTKSDVFTFDEIGDGIYAISTTHHWKTDSNIEKYGLVIKENGVVKKFEIVQIQEEFRRT